MKKIKMALGLATAAMSFGVITTNASAIEVDAPISELPESVYTVVGPSYFTLSGIDIDALYESNINVYVENPEVADFIKSEYGGGYYGYGSEEPANFMNCVDNYTCLQGKKNGETDIVIEEDDVEVKRVHVKSVTLNLNPLNYLSSGKTYNLSGSISGADNSILSLDHVYTPSGKVQISQTGARSYRISSIKDIDQGKVAYAAWKVGDEIVGGGTNYNIIRINAETSELETITRSLFDTLHNDGWNYGQKLMNGEDLPNFRTLNGALLYVHHPGEVYNAFMAGTANTRYDARLVDIDEAEYSDAIKAEIEANLPEGAKAFKFGGIKAQIFFVQEEVRSLAKSGASGSSAGELLIADVLDFGTGDAPEITIDVSDVETASTNFKRSWYVVMRKADGTYETISAEYDEVTKTVKFRSAVSGDYVLGYVDEVETPLVPNTGAMPKQFVMTATVSAIPFMVVAFFVSSAYIKKRKSTRLAKKHYHFE